MKIHPNKNSITTIFDLLEMDEISGKKHCHTVIRVIDRDYIFNFMQHNLKLPNPGECDLLPGFFGGELNIIKQNIWVTCECKDEYRVDKFTVVDVYNNILKSYEYRSQVD